MNPFSLAIWTPGILCSEVSLGVGMPVVTHLKFFVTIRMPGIIHSKFFSVVQMAGNIRSKCSVNIERSNGLHHPLEFFRSPFEQLASSNWNFSCADRTFSCADWTACNIHSKFFIRCSNSWHPFEIFHSPFEWLASSVQNFSCTIWMAGIIRSKFFQCRSNIYSIRLKFFLGHSDGNWSCFEWPEPPFLILSLAVCQPFILTI